MKHKTIGFIGGGNMARSLMGGLIQNGWPRAAVCVADPDQAQRAGVAQALGVRTFADNRELAHCAEALVLAVKPQVLKAVALEIAPVVQQKKPLVISIAAGIREHDLQRWLGGDCAIVRVMPNTPALVGAGASGMYANDLVSTEQRDRAESLLRAVGVTVWLDDEALLDTVTALSGSGPAYFLLVMEALEQAAVAAGLDRATARLLTLETAFGTAKMAIESQEEPAHLRQRVTSPGGTTERAIQVLEKGELRKLLADALVAATHRSRELADLLGRDT